MKKMLIKSGLLITSFFIYNQTYANCTLSKGFTTVDIPMTIGTIVVRPTDPIGTVLQKNTFTISPNNSTATCNRASDQITAALPLNYPVSSIGNNVYATNIPGIGIRLYREAFDSTDFSGYYPYKRSLTPNTTYTLSPGYFVMEVINCCNYRFRCISCWSLQYLLCNRTTKSPFLNNYSIEQLPYSYCIIFL